MSDDNSYIDFGNFARNHLNMQCQYAARFISGLTGYPKLCDDLRIKGDPSDYHTLKIHGDDAKILKERVEKWIEERR